jgi:hypothetical protein
MNSNVREEINFTITSYSNNAWLLADIPFYRGV